jgi:hypothetical protein
MDLLEVKNRIAEALVESIFRRARYTLIPVKPSTAGGVRAWREEFAPHLVVKKETERQVLDLPISVKYRVQVGQYLSIEQQRGPKSIFHAAWRQWPDLRFIFVSERPEPGRSCFQVVQPGDGTSIDLIHTTDLADQTEFEIFRHNVEDHEELLRRIFSLLSDV